MVPSTTNNPFEDFDAAKRQAPGPDEAGKETVGESASEGDGSTTLFALDSTADAAQADPAATLFGVSGKNFSPPPPASERSSVPLPAGRSETGSRSQQRLSGQAGTSASTLRDLAELHGQQRYAPQREVGRGGMGRVLLAVDEQFDREVAIKELLPGKAGRRSNFRSQGELSDAAARFLREARVTGSLEHPGIIPVYEIGERQDGSVFYTMKFVRGRSLAEALSAINRDAKLDRTPEAPRFLCRCLRCRRLRAFARRRSPRP